MLRITLTYRLSIAALTFCLAAPAFSEPVIPQAVDWAGERGKRPNGASLVIDDKAIAQSGANTLVELLAAQGIYTTASATGAEERVTVAALTAQNIHVYVDGVLQNTATYGRFDWSSLDLKRVESITVYRAGYCPLPYAASFSGAVIDIKTRGANYPQTVVDASAMPYSGSAMDSERISASHAGSVRPAPPAASPSSPDGEPCSTIMERDITRHCERFQPSAASEAWREATSPLKEISYKASAALTHAKNDYASSSSVAPANYHGGIADASAALANAGASVGAQFDHSSITLAYRLSHTDVNIPPDSGQAGEEETTSHAVTLEANTSVKDWTINGGVNYCHTLIEYEEKSGTSDTHRLDSVSFDAAVLSPTWGIFSASISTHQCADILRSTAASSRTRFSGFEKLLCKITLLGSGESTLSFDAGAALDHYGSALFTNHGGEATINPLCSLRYDLGIFGVTASYARLYQSPTMYQLHWSSGAISGNKDLLPETGNAWTLSADCAWAFCPVSVCASYMDMRDKIRYMDNTFKNISRAHILSVEARAAPQMRLGKSLFRLLLAYTYTSAKIAGGLQDGKQIMDVPLHTFAMTSTWRTRYILAGINAEFASKRYVSNWNAEANSEYLTLGAFASLEIPLGVGKSISPYIKAQNITDKRIWSDYTRTAYRPPRSVTLGLTLAV